jgi:tRNA-splicing ligase RtcB
MTFYLKQISKHRWLIPKTGAMRVPGILFAHKDLMKNIAHDQSLGQVANVATLPGIVKASLAMPDIHWGYGFPIGGVAAFHMDEGIVSPGGVGYDINCGCRIMTTALMAHDVEHRLEDMVNALFENIPSGIGSRGVIHLTKTDEAKVAVHGAAWAVQQGFGRPRDLEHIEDSGTMEGADPTVLSERAIKRGLHQLGTLGSGNHFLELQAVDSIYDPPAAECFGLAQGQVTIMIHSGSRGFGHQICDDFLKEMTTRTEDLSFPLPDRQLACASLGSDLGRRYLAAMACAANYAWANRQILTALVEKTLLKTLNLPPSSLAMELLYDVCHNIAKKEHHRVDGVEIPLCVHRKGATRALPSGHPSVPEVYRHLGQPVLIPGDMGTHSYILVGAPGALEKSFASSCHGAGRVLSRTQAVKMAKNRGILQELKDRGIFVQSRGKKTIMEEIPEAYKDVSKVVQVVHDAGLASKVARLKPLGVIKG